MSKKENLTKGELTRQAIEDAAMQLFLEQGYHATSMRQIAERAELALGGIYNHFSGKEEIFEAIIIDQHPYKQILPAILKVDPVGTEDFFQSAMKIAIKELGDRPDFLNLMFIELVEFKGKHGAAMIREVGPKVLPIMERVIKARKDLRVTNPAMVMRSFFGMIISYYMTEMVVGNSFISKLMPKNSADVYLDIYLHGLLKPTE